MEKVSKFGKWQPDHIPKDTLTAVNTEWGAYSSPLLPRAQEDMDLDNASVNAGKAVAFEAGNEAVAVRLWQ